MASSAAAARPHQVVVLGATGFTGRLVCEHLVRDYANSGVRWAIAGRNREKLEQVKRDLAAIDPAAAQVPTTIADAGDADSLSRLAASTDVIIATAGPFAKYGSGVVAAAVEQGSHYCDITGELLWVKRMIAKHHAAAAASKVKIVHCAGFDSTPFDLGVLLLADHARRTYGRGLSQAYGLALDAKGGFSGGTLASGFNQAENEPPAELRSMLGDKYYLWPEDAASKRGGDAPPGLLPAWNALAKRWMGPFVMEPINSRIVQRSSLLNGLYGRDFRYREAMATTGLLGALGMSAFMAVIGTVFAIGPLREFAKKRLPQPGEGPSRELMLGGYWKHTMIGVVEPGEGEEAAGAAPQVVRAYVADEHRDPGYWGTARMLLEAGLCLALDKERCRTAGCVEGGVLTPASALGMVLVERLRNAGIKFDILKEGQEPPVGAAAAAAAASKTE